MKKGYRLKPSNQYSTLFMLIIGIMLDLMAMILGSLFAFVFIGIWALILVIVIFLILLAFFIYDLLTCGFYFVETKIIYKGTFIEKEIPLESIVAIKVIHEFEYRRNYPNRAIFDKNGNPLYIMTFLKEMRKEMNTRVWDSYSFENNFSDCIIFQCVYDEELLQYLISLNPNIVRI